MDHSKRPIDRGWAWVQVFAAAICMFFVVGGYKSLGILFVEFRMKFGASSGLTALMMGIISCGMSLLSPAANNLAGKYTARRCVMFGGIMCAISCFLTAFAPNMIYIICVFGMGTGLSFAFIFGPSLQMVGFYFNKRRSTANGIAVAGASVGQLAIPQLMMILINEYSLSGALIIYSAFILHTVIAGALMTPLSFYDREKMPNDESINHKNHNSPADGTGDGDKNTAIIQDAYVVTVPKMSDAGLQNEKDYNSKDIETIEEVNRLVKCDEHYSGDNSAIIKKVDNHYTSQNSLYLAGLQDIPKDLIEDEKDLQEKTSKESSSKAQNSSKQIGICVCFKAFCSLYEWPIFKHALFLIYVFTICFGNAGYVDVLLFIPPYAIDIGLSESRAAILLSIAGFADLFGRVFGGIIADMGYIKRSQFMGITILCTGLTTVICTFFPTFPSLVVLCLVMGFIGGCYMSMMTVVLVDFLGLQKFPSAFGLTLMCMGTFNVGLPTLLGMLRDFLGSYHASFWLCGCLMILGGISILMEPLARRLDRKRGLLQEN